MTTFLRVDLTVFSSQVLTRCYAILLEMPASLRHRRQQSISDSLHHMIAVITYHMAKVLRVWKQKSLANYITETGKKMLAIEKVRSCYTKILVYQSFH